MTNSTYAKIKKIISCALIQIFVFTSLLSSQETIYQEYKTNIDYRLRVPLGIDGQRASISTSDSTLFLSHEKINIPVTNVKLLNFLNGESKELSGFNEYGKRKIGEEVEKWREFLLEQEEGSLPGTPDKQILQDPVKFAGWLAESLKSADYDFNYRLYFSLISYAGFMRSKISTKDYWTEKSEQDRYYALGETISGAALTLVPKPDEDKEKNDHVRLAGIFTQSLASAGGNAGRRLKIAAAKIKEDSLFKIEISREVPFRYDIFRHLIGYIDQIKEDGDISMVSLPDTLIRYLEYMNGLNNNGALTEVMKELQSQVLSIIVKNGDKESKLPPVIKQVHLDAESIVQEGKFNWLADNIDRYKGYDAILLVGGLQAMPHYLVSPYEAAGFYFDPKYGSDSDFENLINQARAKGKEIIIDVVLGKTGKDMAGFPFPEECYKHDQDSKPFRGTWAYTLDYDNPRTKEIAFRHLYRLKMLGVRWIRCDQMGELGPGGKEFWMQAGEKLGIGMISETENVEAIQGVASATYFKLSLRNAEIEHWRGVSSFDTLRSIVKKRLEAYPSVPIILILDDHDENEKNPFSRIMQNNSENGRKLEKLEAYYLSFYMLSLMYPGKISIMEYSGTAEGYSEPISFMYNYQGHVDFAEQGEKSFPGFAEFSNHTRDVVRRIKDSPGGFELDEIPALDQDNPLFIKSLRIYLKDEKGDYTEVFECRVDLRPEAWSSENLVSVDIKTMSFSLGSLNKEEIAMQVSGYGEEIIKAVDFLNSTGVLSGVEKLKIITGYHENTASIEGNTLVIKLGDIPFSHEGFENEKFLYFVNLIARIRGSLGTHLYGASHGDSATLSPNEPNIFEKEGVKGLMFKDPRTNEVFVLAMDLRSKGEGEVSWNRIVLPKAMFEEENQVTQTGDRYIAISTEPTSYNLSEVRISKFSMPEERKYMIGLKPGGCEILRFSPYLVTEGKIEFSINDISKAPLLSENLSQALQFFMASGLFNRNIGSKDNIFRISILPTAEHMIYAYIEGKDKDVRPELIIKIPEDGKFTTAEALTAIAGAFEVKELPPLLHSAEQQMDLSASLRTEVENSQAQINKPREPRLSAIKATLKRKIEIYTNMTKPRAVDAKIMQWVHENLPMLEDYVIVSWQLEMGFHPEISMSLIEVMAEEIEKGKLSFEEADALLKKIAMSEMAGGLGALMPCVVRGLADNGANVVSLNMLYDRYEDHTETGKWLRKALERMAGTQVINSVEVALPDGQKTFVDVYVCKLGQATQVWITGLDYLYKGTQASPDRAYQIDFYNSAGQAVLMKLQESGIITKKKIAFLLNEAYTYLLKEKFPDAIWIPVNHTVVAGGMPQYSKDVLKILERKEYEPYKDLILDKNGRIRLEALALILGVKILGVSVDHTDILKNNVFSASLNDLEKIPTDLKQLLLDKIVRDEHEEYGSSNGSHPKHFQAPEVQDLIEEYKEKFGNIAMDDDNFIEHLEGDRSIKNQFMQKLDDALLGLQGHFLTLLKTQGINWESNINTPTGIIMRRIVDYKELGQFIRMLEDDNMRAGFMKSGVRIVIGGRFDPGKLNYIKELIKKYGLEQQVGVLDDYNISDAPIIFQGLSFSVMLSRKGQEAAATSPQKTASNAHPVIAVRDGVGHENEGFLVDIRINPEEGNGLVVEYDEYGIPKAESLLECFIEMGKIFKDKERRQLSQFNSLVQWIKKSSVVTHQARGILNVMNDALQEGQLVSYHEVRQAIEQNLPVAIPAGRNDL